MILTNRVNPLIFEETFDKFNYVIIDNFFKDYVCFFLCKRMQLERSFQDIYADYQNNSYGLEDTFTKDLAAELESHYALKFLGAWSNIYNNKGLGTGMHVDPNADVTLNAWVTPDDSIIDKNKNGLILSKTFYTGSHSYGEPDEYFKLNPNEFIQIPYKYNRAIFFKSNLLHKTIGVHTHEGNLNKRVNYTVLFKNDKKHSVSHPE
tara:strand:- start:696 stop:1313 length:618 start_codon:yes stop_codon:yes gene_type:complete